MWMPIWLMLLKISKCLLNVQSVPKEYLLFPITTRTRCCTNVIIAEHLVVPSGLHVHVHQHIMAKNVKSSIIHFAYHCKYLYSFARISKRSFVQSSKKVALPFLHNQICSLRTFFTLLLCIFIYSSMHTNLWYNDFNALWKEKNKIKIKSNRLGLFQITDSTRWIWLLWDVLRLF